jgi:molybdate transport system substrate-binding protein
MRPFVAHAIVRAASRFLSTQGAYTLLLLVLFPACGAPPATLTVSAAASLENALAPIADAYTRLHPRVKIEFNFGGSGSLARQIEDGAPVDIFLSASPQPMDRLAARGLLLDGTRRDLLRSEIVLIVPRDGAEIQSFDALAEPRVKLVALGDPASVPAGDYAKQVLTSLGLWSRVQSKLVLAKDVRQVLSYVETGNADAGLVYATDARESSTVRVAATAPESSHAPVVYPVAILRHARDTAAARDFVAFLFGPEARAVFVSQGFTTAAP